MKYKIYWDSLNSVIQDDIRNDLRCEITSDSNWLKENEEVARDKINEEFAGSCMPEKEKQRQVDYKLEELIN